MLAWCLRWLDSGSLLWVLAKSHVDESWLGRLPFKECVGVQRDAFFEMQASVVHALAASAQAPMQDTRHVQSDVVAVTLLVNEQALRDGNQLVWHLAPQPSATPKPKRGKRGRTWMG